MFDVGWSELVVIAVVALIAIGPKELPGVLRMVGQWMGKIRRMAADFQGQFNEAMREAEMADIKKQFDEIKDTAKSFTGANLLGDVQKDFGDALKLDDKPAASSGRASEPATPAAPDVPAAPAAAASEPATPAAVEAAPEPAPAAPAAPAETAKPAPLPSPETPAETPAPAKPVAVAPADVAEPAVPAAAAGSGAAKAS